MKWMLIVPFLAAFAGCERTDGESKKPALTPWLRTIVPPAYEPTEADYDDARSYPCESLDTTHRRSSLRKNR